MTRLLDGGQLGGLFKMALAAKLPDHTPEHLAGLLEAYRTTSRRWRCSTTPAGRSTISPHGPSSG